MRPSGRRGRAAAESRNVGGLLPPLLAVAALLVALLAMAGPEAGPSGLDIEFDPHGVLRWDRGSRPVLVTSPEAGEGWIMLARRLCESAAAEPAIRAANPGLRQPMRDRKVQIPVEALRDDLRLEAVGHLFPADRRAGDGWEHWVLDPFGGGEESWQWIAELFTGSAGSAAVLREVNPEIAGEPHRGRPLLIPERLLLPIFRDQRVAATPTPLPVSPATDVPRDEFLPEASDTDLTYGTDRLGSYAEYRLRRGEALYSAVVVRFTGQLSAKEVNASAAEIAKRSGITDVTSIPVGYPVRIPLDMLLPRYLPAGDPRRVEFERERRELASFFEVVQATDLSGVHVVIDAGHGGADCGTEIDGLWESTYVYDIACRIRDNLERHTRATVWMTRVDDDLQHRVPDLDRLHQDRNQHLLTRPPYRLDDAVLGVHLRWYLTNDIILNRLGSEVPRAKTVFLSVHADSLHPAVRGAMVYVPSRYLRPDTYTVRRSDIRRYEEYRNHPTVRMGADFKARVEASSRHLADNLVSSLERNRIEVHDNDPVRDRILRGRRTWVPAVLRYTAAQNAVLVECCNMANDEDRRLLVDRRWRENFARSIVEGMAAAF